MSSFEPFIFFVINKSWTLLLSIGLFYYCYLCAPNHKGADILGPYSLYIHNLKQSATSKPVTWIILDLDWNESSQNVTKSFWIAKISFLDVIKMKRYLENFYNISKSTSILTPGSKPRTYSSPPLKRGKFLSIKDGGLINL